MSRYSKAAWMAVELGTMPEIGDDRRSQIVSLLTEAKRFLAASETIRRFRFFKKRNQNVSGLNAWCEGPLSAQDRSFVAGQPSDRIIRLADADDNRTLRSMRRGLET